MIKHRGLHGAAVLLCLSGFAPSAMTAGGWTYQCTAGADTSSYASPGWNTDNPMHFGFRGLAATRAMSASDDQGLDGNALQKNAEALKNTLYEVTQIQFRNSGAAVNFYGAAPYGTEPALGGNGIPSPEVSDSGVLNFFLNCGGYAQCATLLSPVAGVLNFEIISRLSFNPVFSAPVLTQTLTLPEGPRNEYHPHNITFTDTLLSLGYGISDPVGITLGSGNYSVAPTQGVPVRIVCSRDATPLSLTLNEGGAVISFGTVQVGQEPVRRSLPWRTSGTGQADIWTLTYDSPSKSGNTLLLGDAPVTILDGNGVLIPPGVSVPVQGTNGEHILHLDPMFSSPGEQSLNLTVTLTAN